MKKLSLFVLMFIFYSTMNGQAKKAEHEMTLEGTIASFTMHNSAGIPVVFTGKEILGLDPVSKEVKWRVPRSTMNAIAEADPTSTPDDYVEYNNTPYVFASNNILNVVTGENVVNKEKDKLQKTRGYYILPDIQTTLIETVTDGDIVLYGLGSFDSKVKWTAKIGSISGLSQIASDNSGAQSQTRIKPQLTKANQLLYQCKKDLISINPNDGKINWQEKLDPGYIYMNDDATKLIVVEKKNSLTGLSAQKFGKVIYSIDAVKGQSVWKKGVKLDGNVQFIMPYDGGVLVVHDEGLNIFDYDNPKGQGRWKKDYKEKGIRNVEIGDDGIMVYTKKTKMLVDPKTGSNKWKKPEKMDKMSNPFNWRNNQKETSQRTYVWREGSDYVVENDGKRARMTASELIYDKNDTYLGGIEYIYRTDKDGNRVFSKYGLHILNLKTMNVSSTTFLPKSRLKALVNAEINDDKCLISTDRHFFLFDINGDVQSLKSQYYKEPGSFGKGLGRTLLSATSGALIIGSAGKAVSSPFLSNNPSSGDKYVNQMNTYAGLGNAGSDLAARKNKSSNKKDYMYFFTKNDEKELVLVQVDKRNGEEVDEYKFSDKSPVYMVDDQNNLLYYGVGKKLQIFNLTK